MTVILEFYDSRKLAEIKLLRFHFDVDRWKVESDTLLATSLSSRVDRQKIK